MSKIITLINLRTGSSLGNEIAVASTFKERFVGLLGRPCLKLEQGLLLERCNQVHMLFMRFEIGILFLSPELKIVGIEPSLKPWKLSSRNTEASAVLELPVGVIESALCQVGDQLITV